MQEETYLRRTANAAVGKMEYHHISTLILILKGALILFLIVNIFFFSKRAQGFSLDYAFLGYILAGFVAQMIDGALGMAYGVSCSTLLMKLGIPPAIATASVHTAEVFTTGVSGLSHLYMGNVDKKLFLRVVIPGVLGAVIGAYVVSELINGQAFKPYVSGYLLFLGVLLLIKSLRKPQEPKPIKRVAPLGFIGGFLDAIGGGGWGPIVTSNLVSRGKSPKEAIGTVNTAEFFVTFFGTGVFLFFLGVDSWKVIVGLILGGVIAAPIGAFLATRIKAKHLMFLVGLVIILTQAYTLSKYIL